jgi:hypothetical protein
MSCSLKVDSITFGHSCGSKTMCTGLETIATRPDGWQERCSMRQACLAKSRGGESRGVIDRGADDSVRARYTRTCCDNYRDTCLQTLAKSLFARCDTQAMLKDRHQNVDSRHCGLDLTKMARSSVHHEK